MSSHSVKSRMPSLMAAEPQDLQKRPPGVLKPRQRTELYTKQPPLRSFYSQPPPFHTEYNTQTDAEGAKSPPRREPRSGINCDYCWVSCLLTKLLLLTEDSPWLVVQQNE